MSDAVNKEFVNQIQTSLSKHINKPQLSEKLLNKPPFKFLHDIVTNVIKKTGYLSGVFTNEEMISANVTTKETKMKFLEKLINAVQSSTKKTISAKPSKIVAGLEVTKTLELILAIIFGIETKNKEVKDQNSASVKTKKIEMTKIGNQNKTKILEKTKSQDRKLKDSVDHDSQKNLPKTSTDDSAVVKLNESVNVEMDTTKSDLDMSAKKSLNEEIVDVSHRTEEQIEEKMPPSMKSKTENENSESTEQSNKEKNVLRKLSETQDISKPLRPKSSRPPAPNRHPQSNTYTEIPKHSDSFFSVVGDSVNDIDDNIVTVEILNDNQLSYDLYTQNDAEGHLVSQILQTQLEFNEKTKINSSKLEWEGKKSQEMLTKEMGTIKQFIQDITKTANPLSKLITNMQENIDQMNRELSYWKTFTEKTNEKLETQRMIAEENIKPMVAELEKLKTDIADELEMMDYCRANIIKNKNHINYLISERFTFKKI